MNNDILDLKKLDKVFPHLHDVGSFNLSYCIPSDIEFKDNGYSRIDASKVASLLTKYGYAIVQNNNFITYYAELTPKGRDAKSAGGHFAYLKKVTDKEHLEKETSKYDFLQKKFIYKARYLPYIISTIAIIFSALAYFKPTDKQLNEPSTTISTKDSTKTKAESVTLPQMDTTMKTKDNLRNQ